MRAVDLYEKLEKDFVKPDMEEDWFEYMGEVESYVCENFKQRSIGLVCDFADEINKVYTAVFPSDKVINRILENGTTNAMLFVHHAADWDLSKDPNIAFYQMNTELLEKLKERKISVFNYHYPLDNFSKYSTSKTLADALGITITDQFAEFSGAVCGVIGTTDCKDVHELNQKYSQAVGHETKLYQYGSDEIRNSIVGVCAGGGNDPGVVNELIKKDINVLVTGLSVINAYTGEAHKLEKENNINLLGGTHYSSEKFACIEICKYFAKLGIEAEFLDDVPCLLDL